MVVGALATSRPPAYVFVEPPGGWAGALQENARLAGSDGFNGFAVAVSGDTVVVPPNVYFKPAGGWAGVLTENGRLTRSDGSLAFFGHVDVDGNTAVGRVLRQYDARPSCLRVRGLGGHLRSRARRHAHRLQDRRVQSPHHLQPLAELYQPHPLLVRARDVRLREETRAKAPRMIRIASAVANIPPGATKTVRLKLTNRGKNIVRNNKKRRLKGVIEIRNAPGTVIDTTPITIRLR